MHSLTVVVISLTFLGTSCARARTQEEISNERMIKELPRFAEESVADPERARKVKALSKQAARELRLFYKEMARGQEELQQLQRNPKATEAEKEAALARHREHAHRRLQRIAELREETRRVMTAEEWSAFNEKLMQAQR